MADKFISKEEVAQHNKDGDCWIIIEDTVYDVSKFLSLHPAGKNVILQVGGKDATEVFKYFHNQAAVLFKYKKLAIGKTTAPEKQVAPILKFKNSFGQGVPYGDPNYVQGWESPYYNESHRELRKAIRNFVETELEPYAEGWDENYELPKSVIKKCADQGVLALCVGYPWPKKYYPEQVVCGVKLDKIDSFHELVMYDEINRIGSGGFQWGVCGGTSIGLPPIIKFANDQLKDRVVGPCLRGEKLICLAITEPWAGSDVANIQTTAKLSECGKFYIVNGIKKWITNGIFCDYFTTAVRTGGKGMGGLSLLVIQKEFPGVKLKKMKCQGMWSSGTTFILLEDVKVPVENLIGKEGNGFKYIMVNFNHERLNLSIQATRMARVCYEESMKFAHKRKTFGKRLIDHPVIRNKLANMVRQLEATQAFLEQCVYNFDRMGPEQQNAQLSGSLALLKVQTTQTFEFCAREAVQVFGGLGYTRGGQGGKVERLYREVKGMAIPGGSEEILLDLGVRQASKLMPQL